MILIRKETIIKIACKITQKASISIIINDCQFDLIIQLNGLNKIKSLKKNIQTLLNKHFEVKGHNFLGFSSLRKVIVIEYFIYKAFINGLV